LVPFTATSGAINIVYATTAAISTGATTFQIPVYLTVAGNASVVQSTAMTVAVSYVPTATVTGPTALIPSFAVPAAAPVNTLTVGTCTTTLLFPYVVAGSGFDTGIAITNTSNDLLKGTTTLSSAATNQSGICQLTFFGTGAPATSPAPTASIAAGGSYTTLLSTLAPGFAGYAIANCQFLYAHGFAYIVYNFGTTSGTSMGYLADIITSGRTLIGNVEVNQQ